MARFMEIKLRKEEETSIKIMNIHPSEEAVRLQKAWLRSIAMEHKVPNHIRYMSGMSGKKYRYLINNLVEETPNARYLEIGSWMGSTFCSAIYGNKVTATSIDNWSEFGGPVDDFYQNVNSILTPDIDFKCFNQDFRSIDYKNLGKYNIYMYDGPHTEKDQYDGIILAQDALDDVYILIVDDWNWEEVRVGTSAAVRDLGLKFDTIIEIKTTTDGVHPDLKLEHSDWHNGYFIAVVRK